MFHVEHREPEPKDPAMPPSKPKPKSPEAKAYADAVIAAVDPPPVDEEALAANRRVVVDFEAFLDTETEDDGVGVDAEVVVPNFVLKGKRLVLAEDQSDAVVLRLIPMLTSSALGVIGSYRHGVTLTMMPHVFEMMLDPDDIDRWRWRQSDPKNPIPSEWMGLAIRGMMAKYGLAVTEAPGKAGS